MASAWDRHRCVVMTVSYYINKMCSFCIGSAVVLVLYHVHVVDMLVSDG